MQTPLRPPAAQLADELERVSYYGVGRAMDDLTESDIPGLASIARRLAPDPKDRLRVSIATAISKAVLLLDPPKHVAAAAALLWLDLERSNYDDDNSRRRKTLKERHPEVAALLGYKLSSYERHKKWRPLYERIIVNLLSLLDDASSTPPVSAPRGEIYDTEDGGLAEFSSIAEAAAELYYAALTALFVAEFHNECAQDVRLTNPRLLAWDDAADWLFSCFSRFLGRHNRVFARNDLTPDPLNEILKMVHQSVIFRLDQLMSLAELCGPYVNDEMLFDIKSYGLLIDRGIKDGPTTLGPHGTNVTELYHGAWIPWYRVQFTGVTMPWPPLVDQTFADDRLRPPALCLLAAIGERTVAMIAEHVELRRPVLTDARKHAQRLITTFYDVDEWQPLGAGESLRDRADRFFDKANYQLATGTQSWHYRTNNLEELKDKCAIVRGVWIEDANRIWDLEETSAGS
jgi:hypothetical protein